MITKKIRALLSEFRDRDNRQKSINEIIKAQTIELEWAHIYHDTIRGKDWLEKLAISPGRWAGNYSFFYILVRILADYKPRKIVEFGLGESTKLVSSFVKNELFESTHLVLEQDQQWIDEFKARFFLSCQSIILHIPMDVIKIKEYDVNTYKEIKNKVQETFNLYIVDGPFGSERYSRYDICFLVELLTLEDEFIIIIDDYNRIGEKDTAYDLIEQFKIKGFQIFTTVYAGNKAQIVIATTKYRFATSL